jgi:hypothetical protein
MSSLRVVLVISGIFIQGSKDAVLKKLNERRTEMKKIISTLFLFLFFVSTASAASLVEAAPISESFHLKASDTILVKQAIQKACASRKWLLSEKSADEMSAVLSSNRYSLNVTIKYSNDGYTISYKDSEGLKYDPQKNLIHPSYARWLANLNKDINANINALKELRETK